MMSNGFETMTRTASGDCAVKMADYLGKVNFIGFSSQVVATTFTLFAVEDTNIL